MEHAPLYSRPPVHYWHNQMTTEYAVWHHPDEDDEYIWWTSLEELKQAEDLGPGDRILIRRVATYPPQAFYLD